MKFIFDKKFFDTMVIHFGIGEAFWLILLAAYHYLS
jgi:F0F1-type ATP synthase membrane subunit c/vacuolar-type H+-ATPase subunit K